MNVSCGEVASRFKDKLVSIRGFVTIEIPWNRVGVELVFLPLLFLTPPSRKSLGTKLLGECKPQVLTRASSCLGTRVIVLLAQNL